MRGGYVYILAGNSAVLYTGVTNRLTRRFIEHLLKRTDGFTKKYKLDRLVYYERFGDIRAAIAREKQIKGWTRKKKIGLINAKNPGWRNLADDLFPKNYSISD